MNDPKLNATDIDSLGQAILTLTQELWVLKDRQRILEAVLEESGVIDSKVIDKHQPDMALTEMLQAERQQLVDNILSALQSPTK